MDATVRGCEASTTTFCCEALGVRGTMVWFVTRVGAAGRNAVPDEVNKLVDFYK